MSGVMARARQIFDIWRAERQSPPAVVVSERFVDENGAVLCFYLRALKAVDAAAILRRHTAAGAVDVYDFFADYLAASVVAPDLTDSALLARHGASGSGELLQKMLFTHEYERLAAAVGRLQGYEI